MLPSLLQLAVAFAPTPTLPPAVVAAALCEAARLWAPYGVDVRAAPAPDAVTLTVVAATPSAGARLHAPGALAAIEFDADGLPSPRIAVFAEDLNELIGHARVLGASDAQWTRALREQILGRAVGRVLAHEIGHFVLATRGHAAHGLMRAEQRAVDLAAPSGGEFGLSDAEIARLQRRTCKGPAHVAGPESRDSAARGSDRG